MIARIQVQVTVQVEARRSSSLVACGVLWSGGASSPNNEATATVSECYDTRSPLSFTYDHVRQWVEFPPVVLVVCAHHAIDVELIVRY